MTRSSIGMWSFAGATTGLLALFTGVLAAQSTAAETGTRYTAPARGLEVAFADVRNGKIDGTQPSVVQRLTAVRGDMVSFTEWTRTGGLIISQKHDRLRSIFSVRIQYYNGTILHDFDGAALRRLWPLTPGRTATVHATLYFGPEKTVAKAKAKLRRGRDLLHRYQVKRADTTKVPAGNFKTFVIGRSWEVRSGDGVVTESGVDTIWLAPRISWIVRIDRRITAGPRKGMHRVLEAISVKRRPTAGDMRK